MPAPSSEGAFGCEFGTNRLETLDYGNQDSVSYTYDDQGRLILETYEDGETVRYAYDNSGNLATVTDSETGVVTTYYYDLLNRQSGYRETGASLNHSVIYLYDAKNNLSSMTETMRQENRPLVSLRAGDIFVTVNGELVVVEKIQHEILESPIKVYNFQVEGYHTYYVGTNEILVHNSCTGRTGKQARLRELANDDKLSSALRGEIKRDLNMIARGQRKTIRVPSGYNLAHRIGYSAKNGFSYKYSDLQTIAGHLLHHRVFGR